jgi:hypothetical protein
MRLIKSLRARLRSLMGEQLPRRLPRRSSKPHIGAYIVQVEYRVRLVVQAGLSDELWLWLMDQGWRVAAYHPDRREYREIPGSWVTRLIDSDPAHRDLVMTEAILSAQSRTALGARHRDY